LIWQMSMLVCVGCDGLTPRSAGARRCLHCDAVLPPRAARWVARLLGPTGAILLAACYGAPGRYYGYHPDGPHHVDNDHDGSTDEFDCDDQNPNRYPGAEDIEGDGVDQNCDGVDGWRDPNSKIATPPPGDGSGSAR
jgi:hypothetical protein